ncbi:MAG: LTA synthase family protein, partial [Bacillota bacterium]|nr:LTA synthase family protein [Bacillota bacterium]
MKRFKLFLFYNLDVLAFTILIILKICFYTMQTGISIFDYLKVLPPIIASILILISLTFLFNKNKRTNALLTLDIIISIFLIADINYFRYFKDIISVSIIRNIFLLGSVKSSLGNLFKLTDFLLIIDIPFLFVLKNFYKKIDFKNLSKKLKLSLCTSLIVLGALINTFYFYKLSVEQPRLITTMFNRIYIAENLGIINAHGIDIYNYLISTIQNSKPISKTKQNDISSYFKSNSQPGSNNYTGSLKNKNLIMIQVEALQQFVIGRSINGSEITPNLNKWLKNSEYFDNFFYQVAAGGTSDAEFMTNNSLYPASSGAVYYLYAYNDYHSLANAFDKQGYETSVLHGYRQSFWNRNIMYKALGFQNFYSEKDYNIDEKIGLGLSDSSYLKQSLVKLQNMKKPYYSFMITLSSHYPYDDVKHYGDFNVGNFENTLTGNYLKAIHYTDAQLGDFLNELDTTGISKDSIIVLYGDHYAIPKENQNEL